LRDRHAALEKVVTAQGSKLKRRKRAAKS
jgi:hypothetical protein